MSTADAPTIATPASGLPALRIVGLATLLASAASIHLLLTPSHFREATLFGVVFLGIAITQFGLAYALLLRPGSAVFRLALWTSVLIAATWMVTRSVPPQVDGRPSPSMRGEYSPPRWRSPRSSGSRR